MLTKPYRLLAIAGACLAAVTGGLTVRSSALASQGVCRSDPIVVLSSLKVLDLTATIQDSSSDLQSVNYTMHLPPHVFPILVIPTDGLVGQTETFRWVSDQPAGHYAVTTRANTGSSVPVSAAGLSILAKSYVQSGLSNEDITVDV